MSWSVSARGELADVKNELKRQFAYPLAAGLKNEGEKETVRRISETIYQCLETFSTEATVTVNAFGHATQHAADPKAIIRQELTLTIGV